MVSKFVLAQKLNRMKNQNFSTTLLVEATPQQVFEAINNVRGWWSENIDGQTDQLQSIFSYHFQDVHRCKMQITTLIPAQKIVWHVLDNHFNFTKAKKEWIGSDIIFTISEKEGGALLEFTHRGLLPTDECYQICHESWTNYIQNSLKNLILRGTGDPTPAETLE